MYLTLAIFLLFFSSSTHGGTELKSCLNHTLPCHDHGSCVYNEIKKQHLCQCDENFAGLFCEGENYCRRDPCTNNGTCKVWFGNFFCACDSRHHGPICEHELPTSAADRNSGHDGWATLIDLGEHPLSTVEKINFFLNVAKTVNQTLRVMFRIYVDSDGRPMIYGWKFGQRRQLDVELPANALEYTIPYKNEVHHKLDNTHSSTFSAPREYPNPRLSLYRSVSAENPNWDRRLSVLFYFDNRLCLQSPHEFRTNFTCPINYDKMWNVVNQIRRGNRWQFATFFEVKLRPELSPICPPSHDHLFLFAGWVTSLFVTAGLVWGLVSWARRRPRVYRVNELQAGGQTEMHEVADDRPEYRWTSRRPD